jgi:hypothetical protein
VQTISLTLASVRVICVSIKKKQSNGTFETCLLEMHNETVRSSNRAEGLVRWQTASLLTDNEHYPYDVFTPNETHLNAMFNVSMKIILLQL